MNRTDFQVFQVFQVFSMGREFQPRLVPRERPLKKQKQKQKPSRWGGPKDATRDALRAKARRDALRAKAREKIDQITEEISFSQWLAKREAAFTARPLVCLGARTGKPVKYVRGTKVSLYKCRGCVKGQWFSASKHCSEDTADARQCPHCQSFVTTVSFRVRCSCKNDTESDTESD